MENNPFLKDAVIGFFQGWRHGAAELAFTSDNDGSGDITEQLWACNSCNMDLLLRGLLKFT
jgi:hypothetical protein